MGCPTLGLSQASRLSQGEGGGQSPRKGWEEEGPQLLPWEPSPKPPGPVTDSGSPFPDPGEDWKAWLPPRSGSKVTSASRQPSTPPGIPSQKDFLQMLGVPQWSPPYLGIVSIQEHTDRRAGDYSPVHSHSLIPLTWLLRLSPHAHTCSLCWELSHLHTSFPKPQSLHTPLKQTHTQVSSSHILTRTPHSQTGKLLRDRTLSLSPLTRHPPPAPACPVSATPAGAAPPPCTPGLHARS
jgi:hypothetical protein